jgi:hypothetical protein
MTDGVTIAELRRISAENDGKLKAEDVVEAAKPEDSPLHDRFDWDNSTAGHKYRLMQARQLIRVVVEYTDVGASKKAVRVFQSLSTDRRHGGGYRTTVDVLSISEHREQLLEDAINDMRSFQARYSNIQELALVRAEMAKTETRLKKKIQKSA